MGIDLQPDLDGPQGAIAFLKHWTDEPLIFASHTDPTTGAKGAFEARQFRAPFDWDQVRSWIATRQQGSNWCNIYFSVNPATGNVDKKMARTDVASMVALQADVDVPAGIEQTEGIANIVSMFQHYGKPPTDIVASGGGAQAFWRLSTPVPINGDEKLADDFALYSKQIARDLSGADSCWSLDHIMRVPGTVNIPNANKLKKGRKPRLAVWHSTAAVAYDLGTFTKAPPEEIVKPKGFDAGEFELQPIRPEHEYINKLPEKWVKLAQSGDASEWGGDRSSMVLAFTTACMRAGVDDQTIASIIMDPWWKVGDSIREKGNETKRQLRRIIERARKFVGEDASKPCVIDRDDPTRTARHFIARVWPDLRHANGEFQRYHKCYVATEEDTVRSALRKFMNDCMEYLGKDPDTGKALLKPFHAVNIDVSEAMNALRDETHVDRDEFQPPAWLYDSDVHEPADEFINCQNGLLHVPTRKLIDHTPDYYNHNVTTYSYDPAATCPLWLRVLKDYWPDVDGHAAPEIALLQEMMGYSLLPWTNLQKIFAVVGPGRSGKGSIGRVLRMLVGEKNVSAPTLGQLGRGEFGIAPLIHKTLAIVGEAAFSPRDDRAAVTNILKSISGEDKMEVNRKNKDHWLGRLLIRFWLFCNKIPDFDDAGRAFMMRLIPLQMTISFAGKEDEGLADKLEAEIAGIMNWALEGFDRLRHNRGKFSLPESSLAMREVFGRLANPLQAFLDDCCTLDDTKHTSEPDLYTCYCKWCETNGQNHPQMKGKFIESIIALRPASFKRKRPDLDNDGHKYTGSPPRAVSGLVLKRPVPATTDLHPNAPDHPDNKQRDLIPF